MTIDVTGLKRVRLELARMPGHPDGSRDCGYELVVPLDAEGHLDREGWKTHRRQCTVRRFWENADDERGHLIHTRSGRWAFSYAPGEDDDEPLFRLDRHTLIEGEYLSVTEHDGVTRPFRIVSVRPLAIG